jgi:hypothetical protein
VSVFVRHDRDNRRPRPSPPRWTHTSRSLPFRGFYSLPTRVRRCRVKVDSGPGKGGRSLLGKLLMRDREESRTDLQEDAPKREVMKLVETICKDVEVSREELRSGSRRGPVVQAGSLLAGRRVWELGIPQAEAARLPGVTTPAIAKTLKRRGSE